MSDSMDLGNLKKSINDLRYSIKDNTQVIKEYSDAINMSNLLRLFELGMISKEDFLQSPFYKKYVDSFISQGKTKKKSLFE